MGNTTWIVNAKVLTMNLAEDYWKDGLVIVEDSTISYVGPKKIEPPPKGAKVIDAKGGIVMPGLINGHTHAGMSLLRGCADDLPLHRWLHEAIFPLEKKWSSAEYVYLGSKLACLEMIRSGTTCFNDMYYYEEATARAAHDTGMRAICGQTVVEIGGVVDEFPIRDKFDAFLESVKDYPLVSGAIAPHSAYGVSRKTWESILDYSAARDLLIHVHVSETEEEMVDSQKAFGKTPTAFFEELGLWKLRAVAAHGTCLTADDINILSKYRSGVVYNPESNLKVGTKICPVTDLRKAGVAVSVGTDSVVSNNNLDLLTEIDCGTKLQALRYGVGEFPAKEAVKILTRVGAEALHLSDKVGSLEVGKQADIIIVSLAKPHAVPFYNPYSHLVYSAAGSDVETVFVAGRLLMEDGKILAFNEQELLDEAREWGAKIEKSFQHID